MCHVYSHRKHFSEDYEKFIVEKAMILKEDTPRVQHYLLQTKYSNIREEYKSDISKSAVTFS
jgi:hypothetical protein